MLTVSQFLSGRIVVPRKRGAFDRSLQHHLVEVFLLRDGVYE
jgi:hypothetical protein